ncbi:HNH endonuclease [Rhizobium sp. FY34]|uniref:HNH endonuclease n=1 Tax=Rhizobium sp. FY34 TaxID=2562309 RepID=UPI0010C0AA0C|nr:HNH endonuclease [Rhizobium sp. FY34]
MNRWNIPDWLEQEVRERDKYCVYCRCNFGGGTGKGSHRSWEHVVNDANIITRENIVLCCRSCNSSKGAKLLTTWLESAYCKRRGITVDSVADVVKHTLI